MTFESDVPPVLREQLAHAERVLAAAGSPTPRDDALALLGALLGAPIAFLRMQSDTRMSQTDVQAYASWTARRAAGEAIPHITGHLAFMGLDLSVGPDTPLLPSGAQRIVEVALERARHHAPGDLSAAEIGTGCGAIALALSAFEPRFARIYAFDPSPDSLRTATANGERYLLNLVVSWLVGHGLDAVPEPVDLIIHAQCGHAGSPAFMEVAERARARLRPGGTLICGFERGEASLAVERLRHALPDGQAWAEPLPERVVVVVQLPPTEEGDAAPSGARW